MRRAAIFILCAMLAGCSLPLPFGGDGQYREFVFGYGSSDKESTRARRVVLGLDLRAPGDWGGINLGWSDLRVMNPEPPKSDEPEPTGRRQWGYAPPLGVTLTSPTEIKQTWGWFYSELPQPNRDAYFVHHLYLGGGVRFSDALRGGFLGLGHVSVLRAHPGSNALFTMEYDSRDFEASHLIQHEEVPK